MNDVRTSSPIAALLPGTADSSSAAGAADPGRLRALAEEFESLLLLQVMRQMRQTITSLGGDEEGQAVGGDVGAMTDTIDGELARYLSRAGGFGLSSFLEHALSRGQGQPSSSAEAPVPDAAGLSRPPDTLSIAPSTDASLSLGALQDSADQSGLAYAGAVTSRFGWRTDPILHALRFHGGVDIRAAYGQEVPAAGEGRVVEAGEQGSYGMTVVLEHAAGLRTRYAHLSSIAVREGDRVAEGQAVGRAGQSGRATGPHVHLELTRDGQRLDPAPIQQAAAFKEMEIRADLSSSHSSASEPMITGAHDEN